ncbi:AraC family transcriptional regulator with amidase-like domain [Ciceribacter lividus]|uniref:AraC family transcriptional regulator with amidase-like domain n=1 Tax=Ciceribacter lividus TaxID=1197950 RepID=A0A6I7HRD1_9HYPH|nr:transcriptional regulator FtrA [Ciceribacter lividus]RCW27650.1 AraC family transcriptional regulator with amidase-like domain [Ciceribacter lividus]
MTNPAPTTGPLVVALVYDGLCTFEFGIVTEIFGLSRPEMGPGWYRFATCAVDEGPMRAHGGLTVTADGGIDRLDEADIIVVPGWRGVDMPVPDGLLRQLRAAHARGARLVSLCSGAFVLAATGLLDKGVATTHWRYADALRRKHPGLVVDEASLYRSHDGIFTAAGSAAGIDLLIEMIRHDFGPAAANSVARRLVMPAHRSGGQAQFLERPVALREGAEIAPLLDAIRGDLARDWTIAEMARLCRMSDRTFQRRFCDATGMAPGEWLVTERVTLAKQLLRRGTARMEEIAIAAGFGSAHTLRHHFRRKLGISPTEFRARFIAEDLEPTAA